MPQTPSHTQEVLFISPLQSLRTGHHGQKWQKQTYRVADTSQDVDESNEGMRR